MGLTVLRGAQVISMSPNRPDVESADVLVAEDRIVDICERVDPVGADVVDLSGRIVIPGLVNAHLHTWQTAMRFAGVDWTLPDYLAHAHAEAAPHYDPDDIYLGTLAGALNQIDSGVTTIGDWSHNCVSPDHADAAIAGLTSAGVRAAFIHGTPHGLRDHPHDVREIDRLLSGPIADNDLLSLGMAVKGPQLSKTAVAVGDFRAAAERGLLLSMHQSAGPPTPGWRAISAAGLWGPRVNIVHGSCLTPDWIKTLVDAGVSFTSTPENELGQGHVARVAEHLLHLGSAPSLGTDTEIVTPGDVLIAARIMLAIQRGVRHDTAFARTGLGAPANPVTAKQALGWATTEGARALCLDDRVGHLAPGMLADLTVIDARGLNLWSSHAPIAAALHATAGNVEAVIIGGQWRKRDHALVDIPIDLMSALRESGDHLVSRIREPSRMTRMRRPIVRRVISRQLRRQADSGSKRNGI